MNTFKSIHETVVDDIFTSIKDGIGLADYLTGNRAVSVRKSNSLARATSGLTLVFPVLCTNTLTIENATMIAKAIERKNVSMLQMAFSAYNITNATDAIEHLSKFHTNLNTKKLDLDTFMDTMEALGESYFNKSDISAVIEDCRRNIGYEFEDDINEHSLLGYSQLTDTMGRTRVIWEADDDDDDKEPSWKERNDTIKTANNITQTQNDTRRTDSTVNLNAEKIRQGDVQNALKGKEIDQRDTHHKDTMDQQEKEYKLRKAIEKARKKESKKKFEFEKEKEAERKKESERDYKQRKKQHKDKMDLDTARAMATASDQIRQYYTQQLLDSDVKKANELQPSLMLVNFYVNDADRKLNIAQQVVAGVKSKLYAIDSADIITRILTRHADGNVLLKLIRVGTRELSFVKDFLLGLDQARLDALSKSRRSSGNKLFRALERRAIKGRIRKSLRLENSAKAISTLVISVEEAEDLKKYNDIDIMEPRNIIPIMEKLNLLYFVVVDTTSEAISIITDGDTLYETYSFTALEREAGDGAYKKVVNLMTKLA